MDSDSIVPVYLFCLVQTSETGGQQYSDNSSYKVSQYSLHRNQTLLRQKKITT